MSPYLSSKLVCESSTRATDDTLCGPSELSELFHATKPPTQTCPRPSPSTIGQYQGLPSSTGPIPHSSREAQPKSLRARPLSFDPILRSPDAAHPSRRSVPDPPRPIARNGCETLIFLGRQKCLLCGSTEPRGPIAKPRARIPCLAARLPSRGSQGVKHARKTLNVTRQGEKRMSDGQKQLPQRLNHLFQNLNHLN
jgi:hypothetical protein